MTPPRPFRLTPERLYIFLSLLATVITLAHTLHHEYILLRAFLRRHLRSRASPLGFSPHAPLHPATKKGPRTR